jgi:ferredoxin, 2Fe-2S
MGGANPYIKRPDVQLPAKPYQVTFVNRGVTTTVDPAKLPYGHEGLPGSILDIALACGVDLDHACGGVVACSTCHVIVKQGLQSCNEATEDEEDQLDNAPGLTTQSRLGCQCVPDGSVPIEIEIPEWNRNAVREEH